MVSGAAARFRCVCGSPSGRCCDGCFVRYRVSPLGGATQHARVHSITWSFMRPHLLARRASILFFVSFVTHQENRLLHWIVEHPDDIARSNFLRGDHAHFFTNLDRVSSPQER